MTYRIEDIANICGGQLQTANSEKVVRHIVTDSRKISFPSDSMFIAIAGGRYNGHDYIHDLYKSGVRTFLVSKIDSDYSKLNESSIILVEDTVIALQKIAAYHRTLFDIPVIGITGSNGKTIVKEWIFQLLHKDKLVVRSPRSYNSQIGVPLSVWQLKEHHELAIFEAGISKPGEMKFLEPVIRPTIGILTNIGDAHDQFFKDKAEKLKEKMVLFGQSDWLICCRDNILIDNYFNSGLYAGNAKLFTWSRNGSADIEIVSENYFNGNTKIVYRFRNRENLIEIPFTDKGSIENALHTVALMELLGYNPSVIASRINLIQPVAMRMQQKKGINGCTVIDDSYNSDPGSFAVALEFLEQQTQFKKKSIILSDFYQTGKSNSILYSEIGELISSKKIDRLICIGKGVKNLADQFVGESLCFDSTEQFVKKFTPLIFRDEAILLKGSRIFEFEKISILLEEKSHKTVMEVNLNNLIQNYHYFKSGLENQTLIMGVVKASSYGSGSYEIAQALAYNLVDYLAVAFYDEGVHLRNAGIKVPIMIMNPDPSTYRFMFDYNLEPEIYSFSALKLFIEKAEELFITNYPIHLKLDTGMNRLGFNQNEIPGLIEQLKLTNSVKVKSLFSHLAASGEPEHDSFTHTQIDMFADISKMIINQLNYPILRHILNSAGIERFPYAQFEMVRVGIGLYGVSSIPQSRLATVNTLKTTVSQIRRIPAGQTAGYSRSFKPLHDTTIAIVPVGYADGIDRRLGNRTGKMVVKGILCDIVGNVCMDMCMLDVSSIEVEEGEEVIVFGEDMPVEIIAGVLATIPYEIFTKISGRVKRVYIQE